MATRMRERWGSATSGGFPMWREKTAAAFEALAPVSHWRNLGLLGVIVVLPEVFAQMKGGA